MLHPIPPVFDGQSEILILGSFPSVKSRETGFFYGHPQNRFWRVLAALCGEETPGTVEEKKALLLRRHIALDARLIDEIDEEGDKLLLANRTAAFPQKGTVKERRRKGRRLRREKPPRGILLTKQLQRVILHVRIFSCQCHPPFTCPHPRSQ